MPRQARVAVKDVVYHVINRKTGQGQYFTMIDLSKYKSKGVYLASINPGSTEIAFKADDALKVAKLLYDAKIPIYGGDVLLIKNGSLGYSHSLLGDRYTWVWSTPNEKSEEDYLRAGYETATKRIHDASDSLKKLDMRLCSY